MRELLTTLALFFFFNALSYGQTTIAFQSFEGGSSDTWNYNAQPSAFDENSHSDVWAVCDNLANISGPSDGTYFWGIRDLKCSANTSGVGNLDFTAFDISSYTDVTLTFKYYTHGFDSSDSLLYQVQYNNGSDWPSSDYVECNKNTNAWTTVTINIPAGVTYVRLRLRANQNGGSDEAAWDEIKLSGTQAGAVANPSNFTASAGGTDNIDLSWDKNAAGDNVMIAYNTSNDFGTPSDGTTYSVGDNIGSATVIYNGSGTSYNHSGLSANTTYYYKAWSVDGSTNYSSGVTTNATTAKAEPTNHVTNFSATADGAYKINLSWTENDGAVAPDGYLIIASTGTVTDPTDGTDQDDDTDLTDGDGNVKVDHGTTSYSFTNCSASTTYNFKIYPYTNSGSHIDFKTDGTVPSASATTEEPPTLPNAWINELHYDDDGTDANEFVEIVIENASNYTLSDFQVDLYNGSGGASYKTVTLNNYTEGTTYNEGGSVFTLYYYDYSSDGGIQNGNPDGLALSYQGNLIQFLSYEGTFTASGGPADGNTSTDIGVSETNSTSENSSLGLEGNGTKYSDFTWTTFDAAATPGEKNGGQALPVELISFTANVYGNNVILNWQTTTEVNNYGFEIQRSTEKATWNKIGFVEGNGTSNSPKEYSFTDVVSQSGKYSYRLKQIDIDGSYKYSNVVEVNVGSPEKFELGQNYPNPFNPTTTIEYSIPNVGASVQNVQLKIYDVLGRKVATLVNQKQSPGNYKVKFDASKLNSGVYFYTLRTGDFVSTKKMIIMK